MLNFSINQRTLIQVNQIKVESRYNVHHINQLFDVVQG
jgi:hypothetical protein